MPAQVWGGTCIAALHCASRAWQRPRSGLGLAMTLAGMAGAGLGGGTLCYPQLPNPNLGQLLPPTSLEWKVEEARCPGSDQGKGSLGE